MRRLLALALACAALSLPAATATAAVPVPDAGGQRSAERDQGFTATKTIGRRFVEADGSVYEFPTYDVTVTADRTRDLRGRQRILISWSGAQPSGGRASNPYGESGLNQEYPVVIMQCRGTDDPALPVDQQLRPETCWTGSVIQRSQVQRSPSEAPWTRDADGAPADRERVSGSTPFPAADVCPTADTPNYYTRLTPFVAAKGTTFPACDAANMPPEAAVGAAFPPAEIAAFTDEDGTGRVQFEVRSDVENESLGCRHDVACTVVVIPIVGVSCTAPSEATARADEACRKGGRFLPGSSNFANEGADLAVSPALWWSPSNWKHRFSIPITMGLPPDTCDVLDKRAPTAFYGSELLAQAALQWAPAYCLDKDRFKFQLNQMSDEAGWNLMTSGEGAAAVVSSAHEAGEDPVGYAPTAVTGFGIGYQIDRPDNAGEFTDLRLNARLLAKLVTQSYTGSDLGKGHPGMADNPMSIMSDPEFVALNPGLSQNDQEAAATLLSLSDSSDVIQRLTEYIAEDKDAMAFIDGKADQWGMVVNPEYEKLEMPRSDIPLLDTYVPQTQSECRQKNPGVYFSQLAAPVTTMRKIAEALLDAWPNVQTRCDFDPGTGLFKLGRIDRQSYGSRFMLGLVSLGDADRYGLRTAALQTTRDSYVAPDERSLAAAVRLAEQDKPLEPFAIDQAALRRSAAAYPGTMVVYTAARLQSLEQETAEKVAQFIRVATTEGQKAGPGNGELPGGYLPIARTGATAQLHASAVEVADAVEAQKAPSEAPAAGGDGDGDGEGGAGGGDAGAGPSAPDAPPSAGDPSAAPTPSGAPSADPSEAPAAVEMPATQPVGSDVAGGLLPALILVGAIGCVATALIRVATPMLRRRR